MIEFTINPSSTGMPFPHYWELCVGSCHAVTGLRQDWRDQLAKVQRELGFQYVRFHGLLDNDMSVCIREEAIFGGEAAGQLRYSFFNIDSIFDFLLSIGMKPFIELGFMPRPWLREHRPVFITRPTSRPLPIMTNGVRSSKP